MMTATAALPQSIAPPADPALDPVAVAKEAGLRYRTDTTPGITRRRSGKGWSYRKSDGTLVRDLPTLRRIKALALPPAWRDVWISPDAQSHLQATGRDAKGRKQYRYHAKWREARDEAKYDRMLAFGEALPRIRARVEEDLNRPGLPREKVLAIVVRLLETTLIRVGNEEYARENGHYGLTTLRDEHLAVRGGKITFHFTGKAGVEHAVSVKDSKIAKLLRKLQHLPGQELFQYVDDDGERHSVGSADVNAYLHEITGEHFTAKDFRTWSGTVLAALALIEFEAFDSETQAKKNIVRAIETVAERLGNTPTICRQCYVHPEVIASYLDGTMRDALRVQVEAELTENLHTLRPEEAAVLAFLRERLARGTAAPATDQAA
jgi:DNA topoisomerase-1